MYSFISELDETGSEVPLYLYDKNIFNDAQYWLNRSVLGSFLPRCLRTWGQKQEDSLRDSMYCWAGRDSYGAEHALYTAEWGEPAERRAENMYDEIILANLDTHLVPFIAAHPETQFDIFFPPYSAAEWSSMASRGSLDAMLRARALCYDALSGFGNVTIYDFSANEEWTLNLDNYKDPLHYGQWINDAIVECIAAGAFIVNDRAQLDHATASIRSRAQELHSAGRWIY